MATEIMYLTSQVPTPIPHHTPLTSRARRSRLVAAEILYPPFLKPTCAEPTLDTQVFRLTQIQLRIARSWCGPWGRWTIGRYDVRVWKAQYSCENETDLVLCEGFLCRVVYHWWQRCALWSFREADEEAGNVEHVGREARLVVVHGVLFARLVPHDVEQDVNRRVCVRQRWAIQDGNAQHGYARAFDAKHGELRIALGDGIHVDRVRLCRRDIRWRGTIEDIIYWQTGRQLNRVQLKNLNTKRTRAKGCCTGGDEDESEPELFGECSEVRRHIDVQLSRAFWILLGDVGLALRRTMDHPIRFGSSDERGYCVRVEEI